jgi:hypothetical protein
MGMLFLSGGTMKDIRLLLIILLSMAISACSSVKVSQDYDLGKPLPVLKTYRWQSEVQAKTGDVRVDNPLLNERIRRAVDRVLAQKGFKQAVAGVSDFLVSYQFSINQKIRSDDVHTGFGFGMGGRGSFGGIAIGTGNNVTQQDEGLLVIDLTDSQGTLLWRGTGTRYLPEHSNPEKTEKIYNEFVEKILEQFPPGQ